MNKQKLHLISLGCTKNLVDAEVMLDRLSFMELTDDVAEADVIIVNTCGFIESAKTESINTILDIDEIRKKDSLLVACGCLTERYQKELQSEIPEVDIFTGLGDYDKIAQLIKEKRSRFTDDVFLIDKEERVVSNSSTHAYIKLSEGCNQKCSFCAIPVFRGRLKSRTIKSVTDEIKRLVKRGFFDFSFISQDSSSYLRDVGDKKGLIKLIGAVERIEGVKSAKILYLYPSTTDKELIERILDSSLFENYFDMPIQHVSDYMFKVMKRGKGKKETLELIKFMEREDSFIRTSFIVGHPKESDEDFEEMLEYVKEGHFDMVNIFEYSDEESTASFEMSEKVDPKIIEKRVQKLNKVFEKTQKKRFKRFIGRTIDVTINGESDEHEFLISAKNLAWSFDIDPEILINESEVEGLKEGDLVKAIITKSIGKQFLARVIR